MNPSKVTVNWLLASALSGAVLFTLIGAGSAGAQIRLQIPDESPGGPIYARVERPFVYHTDQWAAIVFYRSPDCVPDSFNLLDFLDYPAALDCPFTMSGFELWEHGPGVDALPREVVLSGHGVPVWFVDWPTLEAAIADDVLTMPELESLAPLKGVATMYHEVLFPFPFVPTPTPHPLSGPTNFTITASGVLPDLREFQYEFTSVFWDPRKGHVRIVFR